MLSRKNLSAKPLLLAFACCISSFLPAQGVPYPLNQPLTKPAPHSAAKASAMDALSSDGASALTSDQQSVMDEILITLGNGYNTLNQRNTGACVTGNVVGSNPRRNAPSYNTEIIKSSDQFDSALSGEASIGRDFVSFSARVHSQFDSAPGSARTRQFLLLRERVLVTPNVNLRDAKLTVDPPDPSSSQSVAMFYRRCGNSYISQVQMGGEFIVMFSYDQSEKSRKSELEVDASASGWGPSDSAHLDSWMNSLRQATSLEIQPIQIGGRTKELPKFTLDSLIAYMRDFPSQVDAGTSALVGMGDPKPYSNLGVKEADFSDNQRDYAQGLAAANLAETRTSQAYALLALLRTYSIPPNHTQGDILDRTTTALAKSRADYQQFHRLLVACQDHFWLPQSCTFPDQMLSYDPPRPGPFIVAPIDIRSNAKTSVVAPESMHAVLRGNYCWRGNDDCDPDGVPAGDVQPNAGFVVVSSQSGGMRYTGRPILVPAGRVTAQAIDTEYGDNHGELELILY